MVSREELASAVRTIATILKSDPDILIVPIKEEEEHICSGITFAKELQNKTIISLTFDLSEKLEQSIDSRIINPNNIILNVLYTKDLTNKAFKAVAKIFSINDILSHICIHFIKPPQGIRLVKEYVQYAAIYKMDSITISKTKAKHYDCPLTQIPESDWESDIIQEQKRPHLMINPSSVTRVQIT
jgi:hypothetical protein